MVEKGEDNIVTPETTKVNEQNSVISDLNIDGTIKRKRGRPKKTKPPPTNEELIKFDLLFGCKSQKDFVNSIKEDIVKLLLIEPIKRHRFDARYKNNSITIYKISAIYTSAIIFFASPTRGNSVVIYNQEFIRAVNDHGSKLLKKFMAYGK